MQVKALIGAGLALVALSAGPARAEEDGRYTMSPAEGGVIRLDRETGAMAFCSGKEGDWSCKPMPDGERELKGRIEELEQENRSLREERQTRGETPEAAPGEPETFALPKEEDVDKVFDYVETMMRKFKERIKRLEEEARKDARKKDGGSEL